MKTLSMLWAVLLLAGCGANKPETVQADVPKTKAPQIPNESTTSVKIDAAAQRNAGLSYATVEQGSVPDTIKVTGRLTLNENRTWHVGAITDGRVVVTLVNPGDRVAKDQVLARMHSHDVHEARATYRRAQSELTRARTNETQARRVRDRAKRLYDLKAASLEQLEHAETELKNMQSSVLQAEIELKRAETHIVDFLGIALNDSHGDDNAHHDEDDDLIPTKSPADGILMDRHVTVGSVVDAGSEMFVISDVKTLWMMAAVPEEHYGRVRVGMPVQVSVQAHAGRRFSGRITKVGEQLDPATRTIQARIELPNASGLLKPEMYGDAELILPGSRPALFVPELALQEVKGNATVFVRKGEGEFEAQAVETGRTANGMLEVVSGLKSGDQVVVKGAFILKSQLLKSALAE